MNNYINFINRLQEYQFPIAVSVIFMFFIVLAFQGFDVCDEGWFLTFYQQIFNAPETVEYNFVYWLSGIVGGIWYKIIPLSGILSFRFLTVLVFGVILMLCNRVLKPYLKAVQILLCFFVVSIITDFGYLAFYYNHLSSVLAMMAILFLIKGIQFKNYFLIAVAGFIVALNVFSRLPNLTLFAFALVLPLQGFYNPSIVAKIWLKQLACFVIGSLLAIMAVLTFMFYLKHILVFENAIVGLFDKGTNTDSNHNVARLVVVYISNYVTILKVGVKLSIAFGLVLMFLSFCKTNIWMRNCIYLVSVVLFVYVLKDKGIYCVYFVSLVGTVGLLLTKKVSIGIKHISFLTLVMMVCLPLGSDGGIGNTGYMSVWLGVPLFLVYYENYVVNSYVFKILPSKFLPLFEVNKTVIIHILGLSFCGMQLFQISNQAYFDPGSRFDKRFTIQSELARGIYTTQERAAIFNTVLKEVIKQVQKDDYLLVYDNVPMLNFLTETKPYMGISWVWVYDSQTFDKNIRKAEREIQYYPVVVQQKMGTIGKFSHPISNYMSENKVENYIYKNGRAKSMNAFLKRNDYKIVWRNSYFNIYRTNKTHL
jgi:hypothetical protein